jgi:hypothetical protein
MKGAVLFAAYGGGRTNDALVTPVSGISVNSKFRLYAAGPPAPAYKYIQTVNGYFLMAPDGGGRTTSDAIVTDLHQYPYGVYTDIAKFRFVMHLTAPTLGVGAGVYTIQTINGNFVTAVGGGGQLTNAIHTDAKTAQSWEYFNVSKCGDLGSGFTYAIKSSVGAYLSAPGGGGGTQGGIKMGNIDDSARFTLIRQADGTYALRTSNGINYVTAVGGGGRDYAIDSNFHGDATQVQAWEKFRIVDEGRCIYTIQTVSGGFVGTSLGDVSYIATNLSPPSNPGGSSSGFWLLYMFDL